jgi:hypothetical protein
MCLIDFVSTETIFEQKLIGDTDFCSRCFKEIMDSQYDDDVTYNLASLRI